MAEEIIIPGLPIMLKWLMISAVPAAVIAWFLGGRILFYVCIALGLATVVFLTWIAFTAVFSTGMEALAFIIYPLLLMAVWLGAFIGYIVVSILKPSRLPK